MRLSLGKGKVYLLLLLVILVLGFCVWGAIFLSNASRFPIETVVIHGDLRSDEQNDVKALLAPFVQASFFRVKLSDVQKNLQALPFISTVYVRRVWPNQLMIDVYRNQPVAVWNDRAFLNGYGEIFEDTVQAGEVAELPKFYGPPDLTIKMLDRYQKMMEVLKPIRLKISTLFVTPRLFWEIMLNNGMKIRLGQEDILTRLQRFVKVYPELFEKSEKKALAVDLRYAHGLAVKWQ